MLRLLLPCSAWIVSVGDAGESAKEAAREVQTTPLKAVGTVPATKGGFLAWLEPVQSDADGNVYFLVLPEIRPQYVVSFDKEGRYRSEVEVDWRADSGQNLQEVVVGGPPKESRVRSNGAWRRWSHLRHTGSRLAAAYREGEGAGVTARWWIAVYGNVATDLASPLAVYGPVPGTLISYQHGDSGDRLTFLKEGDFVTMSSP